MWDPAQPMIEFEPAIKALEPKQTDSQSMGSAIRRDGFCSSMRAGERLSQAGGECKAIGFVGRLGMIGDEFLENVAGGASVASMNGNGSGVVPAENNEADQ